MCKHLRWDNKEDYFKPTFSLLPQKERESASSTYYNMMVYPRKYVQNVTVKNNELIVMLKANLQMAEK